METGRKAEKWQDSVQSAGNLELDFEKIRSSLKQRSAYIIAASLIAFAVVYYIFSRMPDQYEASVNMITLSGQNRSAVYENSIVSASVLPEGALAEAVKGPIIIENIISNIKMSDVDRKSLDEIVGKLEEDKRRGRSDTISISSKLDLYGNGLYTIYARAKSPELSALLANDAAQAILLWDRSRASAGIDRAVDSMRAQLTEIDRQLSDNGLSQIDRATLIASRANLQKDMAQAGIQRLGASGSLELITPAVPPLDRVSPKPLRNGIYASILMALVLISVLILQTILDKTINSEDDLFEFEVPIMGMLPKIRKRDIAFQGIVKASRMAGFYESIGFLKVSFLSKIKNHSAIMITSTVPGEGKSSVTATLADTLAAAGLKVLIIDADVRRGTQNYVWGSSNSDNWIQLIGEAGSRSVSELEKDYKNIQVIEVESGVHLLPAVSADNYRVMDVNGGVLSEVISSIKEMYDYIIIDTPPLMALSDSLTIGGFVNHIFLVVEQGQASKRMVKSGISRLASVGLRIDGFVINKMRDSAQSGYEISRNYYPNK